MPAAADATDLELTGRVLAKLTMEQPNAVLATLQTFAQAADPGGPAGRPERSQTQFRHVGRWAREKSG
jgi:hypothetical protein